MDKVDSVSLLCSPLGIQTDVGSLSSSALGLQVRYGISNAVGSQGKRVCRSYESIMGGLTWHKFLPLGSLGHKSVT